MPSPRLLAIMSCVLAVASGCAGEVGGPCSYTETTGTVRVTSLGEGACRSVEYEWVTGGPSRFEAFDRLSVRESCVLEGTVATGTEFDVKREDLEQGSCTPSIHEVLTPAIQACVCDASP